MAVQTKQQRRAAYALSKILDYKKSSKDNKEFHELANFIVGMPNMILSNGLGQTLAFLLTKKDKQKNTFDIVTKWLSQDKDFLSGTSDHQSFLEKFSTISQNQYLEAQEESLRLVEWLKRYARAFDSYEG